MAQRLGYIGLGIMGKAMARNLLKAGYGVTVHNRSRAAVEELAAEGAQPDAPARQVGGGRPFGGGAWGLWTLRYPEARSGRGPARWPSWSEARPRPSRPSCRSCKRWARRSPTSARAEQAGWARLAIN